MLSLSSASAMNFRTLTGMDIYDSQTCASENNFCGGFSGIICCEGLNCEQYGTNPDAGGYCKKAQKYNGTCFDSDGISPNSKGYVSGTDSYGNAYMRYDECSGSGLKVNERYCYESPEKSGNLVDGVQVNSCSDGCKDGACIKPSEKTYYAACIIRDSYTNLPAYSDTDSGKGYQKTSLNNKVSSFGEAAELCTDSTYTSMMEKYCSINFEQAQWQVAIYPSSNSFTEEGTSLGCAKSGCDYHACSTTNRTAASSCTDTDGGRNYYDYGTVTTCPAGDGPCKLINDYCGSDSKNQLVESYCNASEAKTENYNCPNGCNSGACIKETQLTEQVKCAFDSKKAQSCYSEKGSCSGIGSCEMKVSGKSGEKITWKSTCGGYAYTLIDGNDETASFNCGETNKTETNKTDTCTDSDGGVNPFIKGYCKDSRGVIVEDACLSEKGEGPRKEGVYADEAFCLTQDMIEYCKKFNSESYCNNLPKECYLLGLMSDTAWSYFPRDDKYICKNGCSDGVCNTKTETYCDGGSYEKDCYCNKDEEKVCSTYELNSETSQGPYCKCQKKESKQVNVNINPERINVNRGEKAVYEVTLHDLRPPIKTTRTDILPETGMTYSISVEGLNYPYEGLPQYVTLYAGEKANYKLTISTELAVLYAGSEPSTTTSTSNSGTAVTTRAVQTAKIAKTANDGKPESFEIVTFKITAQSKESSNTAVATLTIGKSNKEYCNGGSENQDCYCNEGEEKICESEIYKGETSSSTIPNPPSKCQCVKKSLEGTKYAIKVSNGWNLLSPSIFGIDHVGEVEQTDCSPDNFKLYSYFPLENKYGQYRLVQKSSIGEKKSVKTILTGNSVKDSISWDGLSIEGVTQEDIDLLKTYQNAETGYLISTIANSWWVKSGKACSIKGTLQADFKDPGIISMISEKNIKLAKGWNFLMISPDIVGYKIDDFKGTCNIPLAYGFEGTWTNMNRKTFPEDMIGKGMVVRTTSECVLGFETEQGPPPLP